MAQSIGFGALSATDYWSNRKKTSYRQVTLVTTALSGSTSPVKKSLSKWKSLVTLKDNFEICFLKLMGLIPAHNLLSTIEICFFILFSRAWKLIMMNTITIKHLIWNTLPWTVLLVAFFAWSPRSKTAGPRYPCVFVINNKNFISVYPYIVNRLLSNCSR